MQNTEFFTQNTDSFFMGCTGLYMAVNPLKLCFCRVLAILAFLPIPTLYVFLCYKFWHEYKHCLNFDVN